MKQKVKIDPNKLVRAWSAAVKARQAGATVTVATIAARLGGAAPQSVANKRAKLLSELAKECGATVENGRLVGGDTASDSYAVASVLVQTIPLSLAVGQRGKPRQGLSIRTLAEEFRVPPEEGNGANEFDFLGLDGLDDDVSDGDDDDVSDGDDDVSDGDDDDVSDGDDDMDGQTVEM